MMIVQFLLVLGMLLWFLSRKNDSALFSKSRVFKPGQEGGGESAPNCKLLSTVGIALAKHSSKLSNFEQSLHSTDRDIPHASSFGSMRQANQSIERTIQSMVAGCRPLNRSAAAHVLS
jgi:hypothetical protein